MLHYPNDSTQNPETESIFHHMPEICHRRGYTLLRLGQYSAKIMAGTHLFDLHRTTIFSEARFRFEQGIPDRVRQLVTSRNQDLSDFAWLIHGGLHLIQPISEQVIETGYLEGSICHMLSEIHAFSRKIRANGIWE